MKYAYGGALEGYIDGKEGGDAVCECFGPEGTYVVGPSLILGGGRLAGLGKLYASVCSSGGVRGGISFWKAFKQRASTGYMPNDAVGEVSQSPPSTVDEAARAICACLLGTVTSETRAAFRAAQIAEDRLRYTPSMMQQREADGVYDRYCYIDGPFEIKRLAQASATPEALAAAAKVWADSCADDVAGEGESVVLAPVSTPGQVWLRCPLDAVGPRSMLKSEALVASLRAVASSSRGWHVFSPAELSAMGLADEAEGGLSGDSVVDVSVPGEPSRLYRVASTSQQSPSAHGSPNEGLLFGYRPLLFPAPPAIALFGTLAYVCWLGAQPPAA